MATFTVKTTSRAEMIDITHDVERVIHENHVRDGFCHIFVPHTTAGITINEGADPNFLQGGDIHSPRGQAGSK